MSRKRSEPCTVTFDEVLPFLMDAETEYKAFRQHWDCFLVVKVDAKGTPRFYLEMQHGDVRYILNEEDVFASDWLIGDWEEYED